MSSNLSVAIGGDGGMMAIISYVTFQVLGVTAVPPHVASQTSHHAINVHMPPATSLRAVSRTIGVSNWRYRILFHVKSTAAGRDWLRSEGSETLSKQL
jgi:hypothetical protein